MIARVSHRRPPRDIMLENARRYQGMGRIIASVTVGSLTGSRESIRLDALVDTGASHLTLPTAWRDRLGEMLMTRPVRLETATQSTVSGEVCGPAKIKVEGFPAISGEV